MVADALQWILEHYFGLSNLFHYLDDYFFAGLPNTQACQQALSDMLTLCHAVQVPLKPEKILDPASLLSILGIELELDTIKMQARLPEDKLTALLEELITEETVKDITCWSTFAESWNAIALFLDPNWIPAPQPPPVHGCIWYVPWVLAATGTAPGLVRPGHPTSAPCPLSGRSSMLASLHVRRGATIGLGRV